VRIAFYHNHPSGGASRSLYELGRELSRNHRIDVYTLETADEMFLASQDYAASVTVLPFRPRRPIRLGFYLNDMLRWLDLTRLDRISRGVAARIDAQDHDVAFVSACRFVQAPSLLAHVETPNTYYCHEPPRRFVHAECRPDAAPMTLYQRARAWWHRPAVKLYDASVARLDRRNVNKAGHLLCNSEHSREMIASYYAADAVVCQLGVDSRRLFPDPDIGRSDYVLSVGALEPHKGFDFLIRSLSRCPGPERPRLVIVGNTDDAGLSRRLSELAAQRDVQLDILVGIKDGDLVRLYRGARAFVYAPHHEPFGLAVLEAMACGLPVVAVAEGGTTESIVDGVTGLLVPRDEAAFSDALTRVLSDGPLARSMGAEGRAHVERDWTWQAAAERVETQLQSLAARTPEAVL
jgi:glycosyltransferase involved in cell wall biosynthesis